MRFWYDFGTAWANFGNQVMSIHFKNISTPLWRTINQVPKAEKIPCGDMIVLSIARKTKQFLTSVVTSDKVDFLWSFPNCFQRRFHIYWDFIVKYNGIQECDKYTDNLCSGWYSLWYRWNLPKFHREGQIQSPKPQLLLKINKQQKDW